MYGMGRPASIERPGSLKPRSRGGLQSLPGPSKMPEMYQVFSMHRAGRPRLAALATGIVFVVTTIVAALVSAHKSRQSEVLLTEPQAYRPMSLRVRMPAGWELKGPERIGSGYLLLASPPTGQPGGHVLVFRLRLPPIRLGRTAALQAALAAVLESVDPNSEILPQFQSTGTLADFSSEIYHVSMRLPTLGGGVRTGFANLAVTTDRQIVGVLVLGEGQATGRDRRLLQEVSKALTYEPANELPDEDAGKPPGLIHSPHNADRTILKPRV